MKRLQGPAPTLPEGLGPVAPGPGACGRLGTQLIRELCVRQTNPTPRACLSPAAECHMPPDQSWWEQMLLAGQQLHSDPVHTLPVCSGLPRGYYVPNRAMIAPPSHPGEGVPVLASLSAFGFSLFPWEGADSGLDTPWLVL